MSLDKFKAAVQYILTLSQDNPEKLGAIRLNKVLWYADTTNFKVHGKSLTGQKYKKRRMGPVPAKILAALEELQEDGVLEVIEPQYKFDVRTYKTKTEFQSNLLSEEDKALLESMLGMVGGYTANAISEETHGDLWASIEEGGEIPLFATLASHSGAITFEVAEWAKAIVQNKSCLLYTSPSPRDRTRSRMPSSA